MPQEKKSGLKTTLIVVIALTVITAAVIAGIGCWYFKTHFLPKTFINGIDVSLATEEEANAKVLEKLENCTPLVIQEKNGRESLSGKDIGLHYEGEPVKTFLDSQGIWFLQELNKKHEFVINQPAVYDPEKAKEAVLKLKCMTEDIIEPENATMARGKKKYKIIPEVIGTKLDEEKTVETVINSINSGITEISLEEENCYALPAITSDNEQLVQTVNDLNKYLKLKIKCKIGSGKETIKGSKLEKYIRNKNGKVSIDTSFVDELVANWANKYDTFGLPMKFQAHNGQIVTVPGGGDYGWCINIEETTSRLKEQIQEAKSGTFEPTWVYKGTGPENNGLGNVFVEVCITEQMLYLHQGDQVILETPVVTGRLTESRATKCGCFAVDAKESPAVLGSYDVQGYETPVTYWAPFNGGQGLHDADWRDEFGGDIYEYDGSHGCVNIPPSVMQTIYDTIDIGTAVVVYELD